MIAKPCEVQKEVLWAIGRIGIASRELSVLKRDVSKRQRRELKTQVVHQFSFRQTSGGKILVSKGCGVR